jgi:hypothetical protein
MIFPDLFSHFENTSQLYNEHTFYKAFLRDLEKAQNEVIIESPFVSSYRMEMLYPVFEKLLERKVLIHIVTRDPSEHNGDYRYQSANEILRCAEMGMNILFPKLNHHRKLAVIDRKVLWEGSLNILSHTKSREIMRRINSKSEAKRMLQFLNLNRVL